MTHSSTSVLVLAVLSETIKQPGKHRPPIKQNKKKNPSTSGTSEIVHTHVLLVVVIYAQEMLGCWAFRGPGHGMRRSLRLQLLMSQEDAVICSSRTLVVCFESGFASTPSPNDD